ncbi:MULTISPECIES: DMT family transporter [Synechococcaceae]|uniref:DMT family transporter n=1 Tax=Synechococcaceae TaxID=1890426 RepID=UPI0008FF2567|nr:MULTISPECIES: DMT family transporter [Synechococcaceae]APD48415.1 EamA family transporter [Synechococcus sp. SynAce01]MCT4363973.1 DMT family transporter [Candidatus Regnicoccus frigidus MAG-AL1]MCT4367663.1 DMT family transporter [Candidatus Regnicoccus frigidus MAG-AL2]TWB89837.1 EamA-like transporter family protein [Synechococcus sp. Ace-Pa]
MPTSGVLAALAAAFCWTLASSLWRRLPTSLSAAQLNLVKNLLALALQLPLVLFGGWRVLPGAFALLLASGVVGIAVGDSLYFAALRRLGTRRTLTIEAAGPAITALAGVVFLAELPTQAQWLGLTLISLAVVVVAVQQPPRCGALPSPPGTQRMGLLLALAALLCGSGGALLSRAALLASDLTPLQSATVRLAAAAVVLLPLFRHLPAPRARPRLARSRWPLVLVATLLGTSAGIVLQQAALQALPGGLAVALLATAPVMALPLARLEGDRPGRAGWLAALLALAGVSLVVGLAGPLLAG